MIKPYKIHLMLIITFVVLCFCGCATIFSGKTQRLSINSNVPGAIIKIDGQVVGQTPFLGEMPKSKKNRTITVEARDYGSQSQPMTAKTNGLTLAATLFGGALTGTGPWFFSTSEEETYYNPGYYDPYYGYYNGSYSETSTSDEMIITGWVMFGIGAMSLVSTSVDRVNGSAYQYTPTSFYFHFYDEYGTNVDEILIRKYAMLNHSQIAIDAGEEDGEYLNALADMLSRKMPREEALASIQVALEFSHGDQLAFGDEIVNFFRKSY